jgi:hypothetical protein
VILLAIGLAVGLVVFVATSGHVLVLPLVFVPLVVFWPRDRGRRP